MGETRLHAGITEMGWCFLAWCVLCWCGLRLRLLCGTGM